MISSFRYIFLLPFIICACSGVAEFETKEALVEHIYNPENGFTSQVKQGDFNISATYSPIELMLANETEYLNSLLKRGASESQIRKQQEFIKKYKESYEQNLYFKMVVTPIEDVDLIYTKLGDGFDSYSQWLQKLLFGIKEELTLITSDKQEIPLLSYQMDRNYGASTSRSFLLTFPKNWQGQEVLSGSRFLLRVDEFGLGVGRVQLPFSVPFPEVVLKAQEPTKRN